MLEALGFSEKTWIMIMAMLLEYHKCNSILINYYGDANHVNP